MTNHRCLRPLLLTGLLILQPALRAQEKTNAALPDDPAQAWAEVQAVHQALQPPAAWRTQPPSAEQVAAFQKEIAAVALSYAEKARQFADRFPTNENVADARITVVHALSHAVAAGEPAAERRIEDYRDRVLADPTIPEDDRVAVLLYAGNAAFMKRVGMRLFTEGISKLGDELEAASLDSMRAALKQFPTNSLIYTMMVATAQRSPRELQKQLAGDILQAPGAPAGAKTLARHLVDGTKPYQVGAPLDLRFTALDGREVDLAKLRGRVVLVEFWSTTCGPCIGEMPTVKAVYDKFHDLGFEVVAISLDDKESALRRFLKEHDLPWPQHFDGKGWENQFAVRYGIFGIPTMWLVDRRGNLRETNARFELEQRVTTLLAEPAPAAL